MTTPAFRYRCTNKGTLMLNDTMCQRRREATTSHLPTDLKISLEACHGCAGPEELPEPIPVAAAAPPRRNQPPMGEAGLGPAGRPKPGPASPKFGREHEMHELARLRAELAQAKEDVRRLADQAEALRQRLRPLPGLGKVLRVRALAAAGALQERRGLKRRARGLIDVALLLADLLEQSA